MNTNCVASFIGGFMVTIGGISLYHLVNGSVNEVNRVERHHPRSYNLDPSEVKCVGHDYPRSYNLDPSEFSYKKDPNYNPICPDLLEIIKATGMEVVEISSGKGLNKLFLEKHGISVEAYDIFPAWAGDPLSDFTEGKIDMIKPNQEVISFDLSEKEFEVKQGANGSFEPDSSKILMAMSAIEPEKAIKLYKGNMVILGGTGSWVTLCECDLITDLSNVSGTTITEMVPSGFQSDKHNSQIKLKMSPSALWMRDDGWILKNTLFTQAGKWAEIFHVHQIWVRE